MVWVLDHMVSLGVCFIFLVHCLFHLLYIYRRKKGGREERKEKEDEENTDEAEGGYSRAAGGGGEMARFEERGEEVYRM